MQNVIVSVTLFCLFVCFLKAVKIVCSYLLAILASSANDLGEKVNFSLSLWRDVDTIDEPKPFDRC